MFGLRELVKPILTSGSDFILIICSFFEDLVDENSFAESEIQKLVEKHNFLGFYKTSAKTGEGVIEAFNGLIEYLYHKFKALSAEL